MPKNKVWRVELEFRGYVTYHVEAPDDERAEEEAMELLHEESPFTFIETYDAVVMLDDDQYTDAQELEDRERDFDRREGLE